MLGVSGPAGTLEIAPGVRLTVRDDAGAIEVAAEVDSAAFGAPAASTVGRLVAGATATVRVGDGPPTFGAGVSVGLAGPAPGRSAVHVTVDDGGLRAFLRPATGADVVLFPAGPGLAAAAVDQVVGHALPFLLNKLAEQTGNHLAGQAGQLVAVIGDVLGLRDATPEFVYAQLRDFATDPVAGLRAASNARLPAALSTLAPLLDQLLPAGVSAAATTGGLQITAGAVALEWKPTPMRIEVTAAATTLPGIGRADVSIALTESGIDAIAATVGPVPIPAGPVEIRPLITVGAGANPPGGRVVALGLDVDGTRQVVARGTSTARPSGSP